MTPVSASTWPSSLLCVSLISLHLYHMRTLVIGFREHLSNLEWPHHLKNTYLFIWLCQLLVTASRIFSCGIWDLVPWPGIKPRPPVFGVGSLSHWTTCPPVNPTGLPTWGLREVPGGPHLEILNNYIFKDPFSKLGHIHRFGMDL